jgi:hypothetical protein
MEKKGMSAFYINGAARRDGHGFAYKSKPTLLGHKNVGMQCNGFKYGISIMP